MKITIYECDECLQDEYSPCILSHKEDDSVPPTKCPYGWDKAPVNAEWKLKGKKDENPKEDL